MEENMNIGQPPNTPTTEPEIPSPSHLQARDLPMDTPKKRSFVKPLLFVLIFLLLAAGIYYLVFKMNILETITGKNLDNNKTEEQESEDVSNEKAETLIPFNGEYVSTQSPDGWSIKEYFDGEGTNMLPETDKYIGLTGLKIFNGEKEVFFMQAVSGIGFAGCPNYAKFKDENPTYYSKILADNEIIGEELKLTDYTNSEYEEFTWLGIPFRRIGTEYVYDETPGNEFFEPPCVPSLISFSDDVSMYTSEGGYGSSTYDYGLKNDITSEELLVVDQILADMSFAE